MSGFSNAWFVTGTGKGKDHPFFAQIRKKMYFSPSRHKSYKQSFSSDSSACARVMWCKGDEGTEIQRWYRVYNMKQCFSTTVLPSGLTVHLPANLIIIFQIAVNKIHLSASYFVYFSYCSARVPPRDLKTEMAGIFFLSQPWE